MASRVSSTYSRQRPAPLQACPAPPKSITFPTHWYRLPHDDNFLICTRCYEDKLHSTPFASLLRCDYLDFGPGSTATCDFNTPRIDSLLRRVVSSNNFQPLCSFAEQRLKIRACVGTRGIQGGNGTKWFRPINDAIPGFVCCEACHEDIVLGTSFGQNFEANRDQQPTDQTWSCDLAVPYLRHVLQGCAQSGDWHGFVQAGRHRISLPACESGVSALASAKRWYNTVRPSPVPDMTVCEACYLDRVGWKEGVAQCFAPIAFSPHEFMSQLLCDFWQDPMAVASDILLAHGVFEKWHHFASQILSKPSCDKEGILDGEWYGLPNPTDPNQNIGNFEICAACHAGWNQSADWGHLFRRLHYPPGTTRVCDLNSASPRHAQYVDKWNQMYFTRDPTPFIDFVSRFAALPKCQGTSRLEKTTWYGDQDASLLMCPSCFEEAVRDTYFAAAFPLRNTLLPAAHHCSLYSPRMREKYAEACGQKSLDSLFGFTAHREQVYQQTIPQIEMIHANQRRKMETLRFAGRARARSIQTTTLGRAYCGGNPIAHNFSPGIVPQTLLYEQQRRDIIFDSQKPLKEQLLARWKEVE